MPKANLYDMAGKQIGEIELSEAIFGIEPNEAVVHEVVKNHLANCRQGTQSALTRAEVSGGGKKPWRQKGTGHARQGSIRAPQWTHGGADPGDVRGQLLEENKYAGKTVWWLYKLRGTDMKTAPLECNNVDFDYVFVSVHIISFSLK